MFHDGSNYNFFSPKFWLTAIQLLHSMHLLFNAAVLCIYEFI